MIRDLVLMHMLLDHLNKIGALSASPEDLISAVDIVAERFAIAENGGPGYEKLQQTQKVIEELQRLQIIISDLKEK